MAFAHRYNKGCGVGNEKDWTPRTLVGADSILKLVKTRNSRDTTSFSRWCPAPSIRSPILYTRTLFSRSAVVLGRPRPKNHLVDIRSLSVGRGRPRTDALRLKSVRVLRVGVGRGRPRTDALRLKSVRVLRVGASVGRGRPRTDALRQKSFVC